MKKIFQLLFEAFIKKEGRKPNNLEMILLKREAMKKSIDERKILDLRGDVLDPNKPILGGTQSGTKLDKEFAAGIIRATKQKPTVVKTEAQIKKELDKQNKESIKRFKDKMKDPEDLAGGGIAGMLGEPTYMDENHRVPFKNAKSVEGPSMGPQNFYDIGFDSILEDVMKGGPKREYTEKDLKNIWNILQGDQDMDIEDLMFRFGRMNPDKKSNLFFELGKDKAGIGWKKQFNEGGRVPLKKGKTPKYKKDPIDWWDLIGDELDPDEWEAIKKSVGAYQAGGRVPFSKGKLAFLQGIGKIMDDFFPGTTKLGKRSKPFPKKVKDKMDLRKALAEFQAREKSKKLIDEDIKIRAKELDLDEGYLRSTHKTHIEDKAGVGSLEDFTADFNKELGLNVSKEVLRHPWRMKRSYPFSTPIVDKKGKYIGDEATQKMYPKSKKFIVKDSDTLTKEIEGKLPSGERAGIDVPHMPAGFKLSREKLEQNFPELSLDQIDEIMNLDKEMQGRVITMLKNRRLDPDLYDELLLKHGDTLEFQGEFDKAIRRRKNAQGGIIDRVPYWAGGSWNMIKEAIKHNKIFGLGGPPYKPGATSFDIKKLTKDRFGSELSLQDLKDTAIKDKSFSKFLTGFKEYKAGVIRQQLLNSKQEAQLRLKLAKEMLEGGGPKEVDQAMKTKIGNQMVRESKQRLEDLNKALEDIDIYKAMKEKTGVSSHASGGVAGMLGE